MLHLWQILSRIHKPDSKEAKLIIKFVNLRKHMNIEGKLCL